jgi:nicotinamidase/pyrazinamidase
MDITPADALLLIDLQYDFLPGGALAVAGGNEILAPLEDLSAKFAHVLMTQDWHTPNHISFASVHGKPLFSIMDLSYGAQILWPDHCIMGSKGAELALNPAKAELILRKGFHAHSDSYSAFVEADGTTRTGLAAYLRERGLTRLFLAGLATDFCVAFSALDSVQAGFETYVITDLCRAIDQNNSLALALQRMGVAGVKFITASAFG